MNMEFVFVFPLWTFDALRWAEQYMSISAVSSRCKESFKYTVEDMPDETVKLTVNIGKQTEQCVHLEHVVTGMGGKLVV